MRSVKFCSCFGGTDVSVPYDRRRKFAFILFKWSPTDRRFNGKINRAIVGVDNLGDPLRFDVFFGLPRSSAPTHYDEYLNQAIVGNGTFVQQNFAVFRRHGCCD